jgi:hypothetical protein
VAALVAEARLNDVVFSSGIEADFLTFNSGAQATFAVSETRGHLVVE